jgi:hypothetical protein
LHEWRISFRRGIRWARDAATGRRENGGEHLAKGHDGNTRSRNHRRARGTNAHVTAARHGDEAGAQDDRVWAYIAAVAGVLIASQIVSSGNGSGSGADNNGDAFNASRAWLYVTILTVGYMVSRGFAKAGSHEPYWDGGDNQDRR